MACYVHIHASSAPACKTSLSAAAWRATTCSHISKCSWKVARSKRCTRRRSSCVPIHIRASTNSQPDEDHFIHDTEQSRSDLSQRPESSNSEQTANINLGFQASTENINHQGDDPNSMDPSYEFRNRSLIPSNHDASQKPNAFVQVVILALVPLLWGTYGPAVRNVYVNAGVASIDSFQLNLLCYVVSTSCLWLLSMVSTSSSSSSYTSLPTARGWMKSTGLGRASIFPWDSLPREFNIAAFELGMYLFLGSTVQLLALETMSVSRAAFLVQLTSVMVPIVDIVQGLSGLASSNQPSDSSSKRSIRDILKLAVSTVLAGVGVGLATYDGTPDWSLTKFTSADVWMLLSATSYSCHVIRLSKWSRYLRVRYPDLTSVVLARTKSMWQLVFAAVAVIVSVGMFRVPVLDMKALFVGNQWVPFYLSVVWIGVFCSAIPTWFQTKGQQTISASASSVIYATQPIWSALFAWWLLNESVPVFAVPAAALLMVAAFIQPHNSDN